VYATQISIYADNTNSKPSEINYTRLALGVEIAENSSKSEPLIKEYNATFFDINSDPFDSEYTVIFGYDAGGSLWIGEDPQLTKVLDVVNFGPQHVGEPALGPAFPATMVLKGFSSLWSTGKIDSAEFGRQMGRLVFEQYYIKAPNVNTNYVHMLIPSWVKSTAGWWGKGQLSDDEFLGEIQYLVDEGIIKILPN
jgi:hypothetical protein